MQWMTISVLFARGRYTYIHGQCVTVGVGGFLAHGGYNALGTTARHGLGVQSVLGLKAVLADGSIALVDPRRSVIRKPNGATQVVPNTGDNDLFFALRGAGSSFAVITEFLYRVSYHWACTLLGWR